MRAIKTRATLTREYREAERARSRARTAFEAAALWGIQQALAWALNDRAMAPVRAALGEFTVNSEARK